MRLIDADKLYPDTFGKGRLAVSQSQIADEPTVQAVPIEAVLDILEKEGHKWGNDYRDWVDAIEEIKNLPSVNPQESSITWVTGADGAKIAFKDVPVWKVIKICQILESEG